MRFITTMAACLAACAAASPVDKKQPETVAVRDFAARIASSPDGSKMAVKFTMDGGGAKNLECAAGDLPLYDSGVRRCGNSPYSFEIYTTADELTFMVRVLHQLRPGVQSSGQEQVPTQCTPGPNDVLVCSQNGAVTVRMDSQ
ncbi:hypothetical protein HIM_06378 [Hirsutella minnesotensis 3608]|uniref:AA1-like domain-containing protein n=1 Tax=Hirsutella minnesotensis 3608 TaxID=1043627 RepID=A0A0F7ZZF8_9HYPO|nr:hypothetical protein HIM_06378 [Hirsutella minnesotensis 3608]